MNKVLKVKETVERVRVKLTSVDKDLRELFFHESVEYLSKLQNIIDIDLERIVEDQEQDYKSGNKKPCKECKGRGYEVEIENRIDATYPSNLPDSGFVSKDYKVEKQCKECKGKGYKELKWV